MRGETVTLLTTRPDRDRELLAMAERQVRQIGARTGWSAPLGIEIRVYPDTETFRNATGEPGWVAARTAGKRISMQPTAKATAIRHEVLHVFVETQATASLPVWFREGLVEYLDGAANAGSSAASGAVSGPAPDADLRQTEDAARARRAYAAAARRVSGLVRRYGERNVLAWLQSGLPREVASATAPAGK